MNKITEQCKLCGLTMQYEVDNNVADIWGVTQMKKYVGFLEHNTCLVCSERLTSENHVKNHMIKSKQKPVICIGNKALSIVQVELLVLNKEENDYVRIAGKQYRRDTCCDKPEILIMKNNEEYCRNCGTWNDEQELEVEDDQYPITKSEEYKIIIQELANEPKLVIYTKIDNTED